MHFFTRRNGLPVTDSGDAPRHLQHPLSRLWLMHCCCLAWAVVTAAFGAGVVLLMQLLESALLPAYPFGPSRSIWLLFIPIAGTFAASLLTHKRPGAVVPARLLLVASGMPAGVEGAAMRFGAIAAPAKYFNDTERELLAVCGITGAIAGVFGAPVAALVFTFTFVTKHKPLFVIPAAVAGALLHYLITGKNFPLTFRLHLDVPALGVYTLLGIICGLAAAALVRSIQGLQTVTTGGKFRWWPVAAAVAVGLIAWYKPDSYGQAFQRTALVLSVQHITIALLIALSLYRMLAFAAAKGAGMVGGIISPLLTMGAAWGLLMALLLQLCFPAIVIDPRTAALIGAAALIAGATRGWLFAVLLMVEISGEWGALLPVGLAGIAAYGSSAVFLSRRTAAQCGRD